MAAESMPQRASAIPEAIGPETLIGGRFRVQTEHREDGLGRTWIAKDEKTGKTVGIRELFDNVVTDKADFEPLREHIKEAATLKHRNLVATYGVGTYAGSTYFLAHEWVRGTTIEELLARRRDRGRPLSLRGIYNVVAHICKGLAALHETGYHGTLRPAVVWVSKTGRVKIGELGQGAALIESSKWSLLEEDEQAFIAPELKTGAPGGPQSDVFGVGAVLYALLTMRAPAEDFEPPSQVHPDANEMVDAIVARCLDATPDARYASPRDIVSALLPLVAQAPEADPNDFEVDIEIDVDVAASLAPPRPPQPKPPAVPQPPAANGVRPRAVAAPTPPIRPVPPAPPASRPATPGDFNGLVEDLLKDDSSRWMAVKDGMDHGPFTGRELIKLIVQGEVLEEHFLIDMSTNDRKPLAEYEQFHEFVAQQKLRRSEADHQAALQRSSKVETRSNVAKFSILAGAVVVVLGLGGSYLMSRQRATDTGKKSDLDLAALYESGNVKITGTAGILKHKARTGKSAKGAKGAKGARRTASSGGFASYEDAMNIAMDIGSAAKSGGERQLTSADVAGTMNRNLNSLFSCVSQELRRGGRLATVRINLAIQGSGAVMGASVNAGSGAFKGCIAGKVKRIRFPSFPAPRMGARYSFDVD